MKSLLAVWIIFIGLIIASFCYAETAHIYVSVTAPQDVKFEDIENPAQFMRSCIERPDSSSLCEDVVNVDDVISRCSASPDSDGLCENIVTEY